MILGNSPRVGMQYFMTALELREPSVVFSTVLSHTLLWFSSYLKLTPSTPQLIRVVPSSEYM